MSAVIVLRSLGGVGGGMLISGKCSVMIIVKGLSAAVLRYSHRAKHPNAACMNAWATVRTALCLQLTASESTLDSIGNTTH